MKLILIPILLCLFSCSNKQNNSVENKAKISETSTTKENIEIEKILLRQLKAGGYASYYDTDYAYYKYDKSDLEITFKPIRQILIKYGFIFIDKDVFNRKVKTIFGDIGRYDDIFYINNSNKCFKPQKVDYYDPDGFRNDLYFSIEDRIILNLYSLPEIIDYQNDYKEIASEEDKIPTEVSKIGETEKIYITKWKDIKDLAQQRDNNIQTLVNRNKYLFNDSKASLVWLKFHDEYFLESLVKVFGYVGDKDLLKWVLDRNLNEEEFSKLLFTKTCDNRYIFHKEIFEVMTQADVKSQENYLLFLRGRTDFPKLDDLSFRDAAKINALYCYYATKFTASIEQGDVYTFFPKLNDPKFEEEFKKNNYYNLPDFKELYDDTKSGGIGLPE
ncbi:hypothetical protein [Flavobacterium ginsengiterrae]|uniref:DKNYY family protein n=1 Tax=Flavobacterium ginsengiterrae TaxID=871695 RepID=A0ABP7GBP1_9FLAO